MESININFEQNETAPPILTKINRQTNWFIGIFSILVTGLLGIFGKIAFFPNLQKITLAD